MPRFVILRHDPPPGGVRPRHWDFMLEAGGVLRTWALAEAPSLDKEIAAERLADHRLAYLDYEGEISGGRGSVSRWDAGDYRVVAEDDRTIVVRLEGRRIAGEVTLAVLPGGGWRFFARGGGPAP